MKHFACSMKFVLLAVIFGCGALVLAQRAETPRLTTPGNGPYGVPQATFLAHQLGTDHAEGITTMNIYNLIYHSAS